LVDFSLLLFVSVAAGAFAATASGLLVTSTGATALFLFATTAGSTAGLLRGGTGGESKCDAGGHEDEEFLHK